jgi:SAM-dependent methyltransferase
MNPLEDRLAALSPRHRALLEMRLQQRRGDPSALAGNMAPGGQGDEENLLLARSVESVEGLLSRFYGRYPWPWPAKKLDFLEDSGFETAMLNQDVGDWQHRTIPEEPRIWVAGCGVNQALIVALRFPRAEVVGSDISTRSLELCERTARQVGAANLRLREESINQVAYDREFDFVVCTGVIHHNAEPAVTLARLTAAMKPGGVLELMVYNRFHRIVTSAFQKAVRSFGAVGEEVDFEAEVALAHKIVDNLPVKGTLEKAFIQYMEWSESDFADLLVQPVEHSYTVESLEELARSCGLELALPCVSPYARHLAANLSWNLDFPDPELRERYFSLPDSRRWQITNLLLHDRSPLLWFYLRRAEETRRTERDVCDELLETRFERCETLQRSYVRDEESGNYSLIGDPLIHPLEPPRGVMREIAGAAGPDLLLGEVLRRLGVDSSFPTVQKIRSQLTTSAFPYLRAVR